MARKKTEENCPICGQFLESRVVAYQHKPFIDGRTYEGGVTLIPSERDPSTAVTWGLNYYHWLGGEIVSYIDNVLIQRHRFPSDLLDLIRGAVCDSARKNRALDQLSNA